MNILVIFGIMTQLTFYIPGNLAHGITFNSPFFETTGRKFACPGEIGYYVCNGTGNSVDVYAPPYIEKNQRLSFSATDAIGSISESGEIHFKLLSTSNGSISAGVLVHDLEEYNITCEVRSSDGSLSRAKIVHKPSEFPSSVTSQNITHLGNLNQQLSAVKVTWKSNNGNYDLKHYKVTVYSSNDSHQITSVNVFPESENVSVILQVPNNIEIYAKIITTSHCYNRNDGVITGVITASSDGIALHFTATMVFVSVVAVGLVT